VGIDIQLIRTQIKMKQCKLQKRVLLSSDEFRAIRNSLEPFAIPSSLQEVVKQPCHVIPKLFHLFLALSMKILLHQDEIGN
jgi:hypothetical protein